MIKIKVNEKNIEKALKEYKLKFKRIKVKEELINRKNFTKPSEEEREEKQKAIYIRKKILNRNIQYLNTIHKPGKRTLIGLS